MHTEALNMDPKFNDTAKETVDVPKAPQDGKLDIEEELPAKSSQPSMDGIATCGKGTVVDIELQITQPITANVSEITQTSQPNVQTVNTQTTQPTVQTVNTQTTQPTVQTVNTQTTQPTVQTVNTQTTNPTVQTVNTQTTQPTVQNVNTQTTQPTVQTVNTQTTQPTVQTVNTQTTELMVQMVNTMMQTTQPTVQSVNTMTQKNHPSVQTVNAMTRATHPFSDSTTQTVRNSENAMDWSWLYGEMTDYLKSVNLEVVAVQNRRKMAANLSNLSKQVESTQNNLIWLELLSKLSN